MSKQRRSRGLIFSAEGWQKLVTKKRIWEQNHKSGIKLTLEDLSEITGLSYNTVLKIQDRQQGVDKRSLVKFALAFNLELITCDCVSPNSRPKPSNVQLSNRVNWNKLIELTHFCGREAELTLLKQLLVKDYCRLVSIQGISGIGKTTFCAKLVEQVQRKYDRVIWRSLEDKFSLKELLIDLLQVLSDQSQAQNVEQMNTKGCIQQLIGYLRSHKCLIIFDGLDTTMASGKLCGSYHPECQDYYDFIKYLGGSIHQSCLLLTTREKPRELKLLEGKLSPVRSFNLSALSPQTVKKILSKFDLDGTETDYNCLIAKVNGHPLALRLVTQNIQATCDRQIARFLERETVIPELQDLWQQQLHRLSSTERKIFDTIVECDSPPCFSSLRAKLPTSIFLAQIIDALESLLGRSLIIKESQSFTVCSQFLI